MHRQVLVTSDAPPMRWLLRSAGLSFTLQPSLLAQQKICRRGFARGLDGPKSPQKRPRTICWFRGWVTAAHNCETRIESHLGCAGPKLMWLTFPTSGSARLREAIAMGKWRACGAQMTSSGQRPQGFVGRSQYGCKRHWLRLRSVARLALFVSIRVVLL
jgi:hypothetical protein